MPDAEKDAGLRETFDTYVAAQSAASRAFVAYKFGEVAEVEVHRLQGTERVALDAHLAAITSAERARANA